jgi:hypothetical protein
MRSEVVASASCVLAVLAMGCVGTTGGDIVELSVAAAGPADATAGAPYVFTNGRGFEVTLTRARLHVGGVYLNESRPLSGAQATSCRLPGLYIAEVPAQLDVDLLSPAPQPFPSKGHGTTGAALVGEVWLTGGDADAEDDPTVILDAAGSASQAGLTIPFTASLTIGENRTPVPVDPSLPGASPICRERIVSPIPLGPSATPGGELRVDTTGTLLVRVDPKTFFLNVDFAALPASPSPRTFADGPADEASNALYRWLHDPAAYSFAWQRE